MKIIDGFFDFTYTYAEDIGGISVCVLTLINATLTNEIIRVVVSLLTSIISAYLIHIIKPYFGKITKQIKKTIHVKRNNKKARR